MPRMRFTINNQPLRGGLTTAGQHGTIPENQLWQAKNCMSGLDGLMSKRPGLWQWGQVLKTPRYFDDDDNEVTPSFYELFTSLDSWRDDEATSDITWYTSKNKLNISVTDTLAADGGSVVQSTLGRVPKGTQGDATGSDWSVRFTAISVNMPDAGAFVVSCTAKVATPPYAFKILGDKVQYYATGGTWTDWFSFAFNDAAATTFEFRVDANGSAYALVNETMQTPTVLVSALATYTAMSEGTYIEFHTSTSDQREGQYTVKVSDLMLEGAVVRTVDSVDLDPFVASRLGAGTDFKSVVGGYGAVRNLLVASNKYLYRDSSLVKFWSPLIPLSGGNVTFAQFRTDAIIFDGDSAYGSTVYRWNGRKDPERLDDAPDVRFGTEHRTRLFAAGDKKFPLRLYYTASRDPKVWFAPESDADGQETVSEVLDAGSIEIAGKRGDEIVAIYGEFYGSCIICTNRGSWRLTGSSPLSFSLENIAQDTGAASQAGLARMGNDLWMSGRQGITTIQTVQQFGDMQAAMPSAPIADLWAPGISNSSIKVDQYQLYRNSLAWNPNLQLMLFAFARQGASDVSSIMVYNPVTQSWYGPWESDTTFVSEVEVASPVVQATMHGTSTGKVGITDPNLKADFGVAYTQTFESPYLCGRSVDPRLTHQIKTWKSIRLYVQIRGDWDLDVKWQCDDETYQTRVENQNMFNMPKLGVDWRLNVDPDGRVHSNQLIGVIEIPLDVRGRYFKFEVSTADDYVGEDLAIQGYEVEFTADGPDQEQE